MFSQAKGKSWKNERMSDETPNSFQCGMCGQWHDGPPMSYSEKVPHAVTAIPDAELDRRVVFTLDQCVIDQREFYLRGRIPVPVIGRQEPFIWGVWALVSQEDFIRCNERWKVEGRETDPPFQAFLHTRLPMYGDTVGIELKVRTQVVGRRPHFEVVDTKHPLAVEQQEGMTMERARQIAESVIHSSD
jgi:hypothetical protein